MKLCCFLSGMTETKDGALGRNNSFPFARLCNDFCNPLSLHGALCVFVFSLEERDRDPARLESTADNRSPHDDDTHIEGLVVLVKRYSLLL